MACFCAEHCEDCEVKTFTGSTFSVVLAGVQPANSFSGVLTSVRPAN